MGSTQAMSQADRRLVAVWAADCAERVLGVFEAEAPGDRRPRDAIAVLRAFARGELRVRQAMRLARANAAAREVAAPAAAAAARAAGQAAATPHMGAHALGAAAYAAKAAGLAAPDQPDAVAQEIRWQLERLSPAVRAALCQLPPVGERSDGPLGPGLLARGLLGSIIRDLQAQLPNGRAVTPSDYQRIDLHGQQLPLAKGQLTNRLGLVDLPGGEESLALHRAPAALTEQQVADPHPRGDGGRLEQNVRY